VSLRPGCRSSAAAAAAAPRSPPMLQGTAFRTPKRAMCASRLRCTARRQPPAHARRAALRCALACATLLRSSAARSRRRRSGARGVSSAGGKVPSRPRWQKKESSSTAAASRPRLHSCHTAARAPPACGGGGSTAAASACLGSAARARSPLAPAFAQGAQQAACGAATSSRGAKCYAGAFLVRGCEHRASRAAAARQRPRAHPLPSHTRMHADARPRARAHHARHAPTQAAHAWRAAAWR
jgi:hypothetical protein